MICCYGGASEAVSAIIGSVWKNFWELSGVLVRKQGLSMKQLGKIYQCFVRPVLMYCCEMWELTVEMTEKRKKGQPRKLWEECIKKDLKRYGLRREDAFDQKKWQEQIRATIANPGQPG